MGCQPRERGPALQRVLVRPTRVGEVVGPIQPYVAGVFGDPSDVLPAMPIYAVLALDHQCNLDHLAYVIRSATLGSTCSGRAADSAAEVTTPVSTSSASMPAACAPATSASGLSPTYRHSLAGLPTLSAASHRSVIDGLPTTTSGGRPTARSSAAAKTPQPGTSSPSAPT